ncbi:MAG: hypothetical protein GXP32_00640 [Kiritimatiellaeota bacterium]|nr:hypothetical protein [Kiritimatiellota bacterium]
MNELSPQLEEMLEPMELQLKFFWFVQFSSYAIYVFIAFIIDTRMKEFASEDAKIALSALFSLIALAFIVASFVFKRMFLSSAAISKILNGPPPDWSNLKNAHGMSESLLVVIDVLLPLEEQKLLKAGMSVHQKHILLYGLFNTVSIAGLVLSILINESTAVIPFITCSVVLNLLNFPSLKKMICAASLDTPDVA